MTDPVNHPDHYRFGTIEVIDVIEDWGLGFHLGNALKYLARAPHKGRLLEDRRKCEWYVMRALQYIDDKNGLVVPRISEDAYQSKKERFTVKAVAKDWKLEELEQEVLQCIHDAVDLSEDLGSFCGTASALVKIHALVGATTEEAPSV